MLWDRACPPGADQQVKLVRQQAPGIDDQRPRLEQVGDAVEEIRSTDVVRKDFRALDPPPHHMVQRTGRIQSRLSGHGWTLIGLSRECQVSLEPTGPSCCRFLFQTPRRPPAGSGCGDVSAQRRALPSVGPPAGPLRPGNAIDGAPVRPPERSVIPRQLMPQGEDLPLQGHTRAEGAGGEREPGTDHGRHEAKSFRRQGEYSRRAACRRSWERSTGVLITNNREPQAASMPDLEVRF